MAMLAQFGCNVDLADDGLRCLQAIEKQKYDAIFMDLQMPHLDGFDTTRRIRKQESEQQHMPIIAMTANALRSDSEACFAAGMDAFIAKPVTIQEVTATFNSLFTDK